MGRKKAFVPEARASNSCRFCLLVVGSTIELLGFWWFGVPERNSFNSRHGNSLNSAGSKLGLGDARASVLAVQQVLPAMAQWCAGRGASTPRIEPGVHRSAARHALDWGWPCQLAALVVLFGATVRSHSL